MTDIPSADSPNNRVSQSETPKKAADTGRVAANVKPHESVGFKKLPALKHDSVRPVVKNSIADDADELRKILADLAWEVELIGNKAIVGQINNTEEYHKEIDKELNVTLAATNRLYLPRAQVVEAIGADEDAEYGGDKDAWQDVEIRNELRAQIRKTLKLSDKEGSKHTRY